MAIRLTTPSSHRKLAKKCQRLSYGSLVCSAADDTVPVVCVWRHILMERACTQTWTLILQPSMHKHRWSTTVLHRLGYGSVAGVGESESGSSAVECSTCWLTCISNKKSAPCSTGYSTTRLPVHNAYTYVLYRDNALWWLHMIMYTQTQCIHTDIENIYEISHVSVYYYIVAVYTPC